MIRFRILATAWAAMTMAAHCPAQIAKLYNLPSPEPDSAQNAEWARQAPVLHPQVNARALAPRRVVFGAFRPFTVSTEDGFQFEVPADAFVDAAGRRFTGTVALTVREATTVTDFIEAGLVTLANGTPLRSGGMFHISAVDAATNAPLQLAPGKQIQGEMPSRIDEYQLFRGTPTANGGLNWENPQPILPPRPPQEDPNAIASGIDQRTFFGYRSLFPVPDSVVEQLHKFVQWADSFTHNPIYTSLLQNPVRINKLGKVIVSASNSIAALHQVPCPSAGQWQAWLQANRQRCAPGMAYGWLNGRLVFGQTTMDSLGITHLYTQLKALNAVTPVNGASGLYDVTVLWPYLSQIGVMLNNTYRHPSSDFKTLHQFILQIKENIAQNLRIVDTTPEAAALWCQTEPTFETGADFAQTNWGSLVRVQGQYYATQMGLKRLGIQLLRDSNSNSLRWFVGVHWSVRSCFGGYSMGQTPPQYLFAYLKQLRGNVMAIGQFRVLQGAWYSYNSLQEFQSLADSLQVFTRQANTQLASRYGFTLNELGWYNCDIYIREPWQPQPVAVQLDAQHTPTNTQLYVVYPAERMVFQFPINPDGTAHVRLFSNYDGQLLLVSGSNATAVSAYIQHHPLEIGWQDPVPLRQVAGL